MEGGDDTPGNTPQAYIGKSRRLGGGMGAQVQAPHRYYMFRVGGNANVNACSSKELFFTYR
jgi:hypothetical protein